MLLATGVADRTETLLAIDIGTSTEMCLAHRGQMTRLSCAARNFAFEAQDSDSDSDARRVYLRA